MQALRVSTTEPSIRVLGPDRPNPRGSCNGPFQAHVRPRRARRCHRRRARGPDRRRRAGNHRTRGDHGHRHPCRYRERDRRKAREHQHRRGRHGRGHRQAARHQHRRVDRAPAGPDLAACRGPRVGHQPARHRPGLHHRAAERPRGRQHRRQPQRRVRPVPVRAAELGRRVQDPGLAARRAGPRRHHRPAHRASAGLRPPGVRVQHPRRDERQQRPRRGLRRHGLPREPVVHRPVRRRQGRPGAGLRAPRLAAVDGRLRHLRAVGAARCRRRRQLRRRFACRLLQQPGRGAGQLHHQRHEGPCRHGLDRA